MTNKKELIEKLYLNDLSGEETAYIASLIESSDNEKKIEYVPYKHHEANLLVAIGFKSEEHYENFVVDENYASHKEQIRFKLASQKIEITEKRILTNTLSRRAMLLGMGKRRDSYNQL